MNGDLEQRVRNLENEMQLIRDGSLLLHGMDNKEDTAIKVKVGVFACPAETGNYSVTGMGFKPRCIEFKVSRNLVDYSISGSGWMDYNGNQGAVSNAGKDDAQYMRSSAVVCVYVISETGAEFLYASYVSMNNDGFTVNFGAVNSDWTIHWKAVR